MHNGRNSEAINLYGSSPVTLTSIIIAFVCSHSKYVGRGSRLHDSSKRGLNILTTVPSRSPFSVSFLSIFLFLGAGRGAWFMCT